jgi:hypothetical protein
MGIFMLAKSSVKPASATLKDKFPIKSLPGIWPRNWFLYSSEIEEARNPSKTEAELNTIPNLY